MDTMPSSCISLPEEILEHIISYALLPDFTADGLASTVATSDLPLVCRTFNRIAKPFLYNYVHLRTRSQSDKLADLLSTQPTLAAYIRGIRVDAPSCSRGFLVVAQILSNTQESPRRVLDILDVKLVVERGLPSSRNLTPSQAKEDIAKLNSALLICPDTRCLIVRQVAFVGWNSAISFAHTLGSCVSRWQNLEAVDLRMKPTPVPAPPGNPRPDPLAAALAKAPRLRVLRAHQPTLLNNFLLDVSNNPALERIELLNTPAEIQDTSTYFWPFLRPPFVGNLNCDYEAGLFPIPGATELQRFPGDVGAGPELLTAAVRELEAQLSSEPQTLFASQIVAHPRLYELVRAGRLQLIVERLMMLRNKRRFGGDSREGFKDKYEALTSPCYYADQKLVSLCYNGCSPPRSSL